MDHSVLTFAGTALVELVSGPHLLYLLIGVVVGIVVGILPGLGGISGLALLLPFVYGMNQGHALAMMMGLVSVTTVSDTFPSILMGIPGSAGSQATILDGFPLAKKGQAARALSASFTASLLGGVFGAILLTFSFVIARPLLLAVGFGEQLMLVLIALTLVGMLTGQSAVKGLASCGLGLLVGAIGAAPATAEYRMTFGYIYLSDGIPLVVVALGIFAIPEILDVLRHQRTIAEGEGRLGAGWGQGIRDTFASWALVLRCSAIGALIGALPGLGGTVIEWISYGHVLQSSKDTSQFGKGDIRGVIAPEAANNAKEGGALIPTLFFGIPGSGTNALLLGGLVLIGLTPGRSMVTDHVDLVYLIIWSLALAHVIGAVICVMLAQPIARLTRVRYALIAPFMIVMIVFAAFQATQDWGDIYLALVLGIGGLALKRFGWSRPAMLIGFVLSKPLEQSLYRTVQVYGLDVLLRPASLRPAGPRRVVGPLCLAQQDQGQRYRRRGDRRLVAQQGTADRLRRRNRRPRRRCALDRVAAALPGFGLSRDRGDHLPGLHACRDRDDRPRARRQPAALRFRGRIPRQRRRGAIRPLLFRMVRAAAGDWPGSSASSSPRRSTSLCSPLSWRGRTCGGGSRAPRE